MIYPAGAHKYCARAIFILSGYMEKQGKPGPGNKRERREEFPVIFQYILG
jgi:hypothetical protein